MVAALVLFTANAGASGQWTYVLEDGGAIITGYETEPEGDLSIPSELDGHPVTGIGDWVFMEIGLTTVNIPDGVIGIGSGAFFGCGGLTSVTIPNSVTCIGDWAFMETGLTTVNIPDSVTSIGTNPFMDAPLVHIDVSPNNPVHGSYDGVLFDRQQRILISYPAAKEGTFTIPKGTQFIGDNAFWGCSGLTSITIPDGVTGIGHDAFSYCDGLTGITIPV